MTEMAETFTVFRSFDAGNYSAKPFGKYIYSTKSKSAMQRTWVSWRTRATINFCRQFWRHNILNTNKYGKNELSKNLNKETWNKINPPNPTDEVFAFCFAFFLFAGFEIYAIEIAVCFRVIFEYLRIRQGVIVIVALFKVIPYPAEVKQALPLSHTESCHLHAKHLIRIRETIWTRWDKVDFVYVVLLY